MTRFLMRPLLAALAAAALTVGCQLDDGGYAAGELGNGGFYFSCDDAVACSRYTDDASQFPKAVALGSTFSVRYVPKPSSGLDIKLNDSAPDRGVTVQPISNAYVARGANGLAAIKAGYATIASRDAAGQLVDYVVIRVARPDALVVYAADESRTDPPLVSNVTLGRGDKRAFRALAREGTATLAGSLQMEWRSSNPGVVDIESTTEGKVTVVARSAGSATLEATGGTFTQTLAVEVMP
jgi:hypothetical protein